MPSEVVESFLHAPAAASAMFSRATEMA